MKKKIGWLSFVTALLAFTVMVNSCKKETGPQGPAGNANVHSRTIIVHPADWSSTSTSKNAVLIDSDITQAVIDKGAIQAYVRYGSTWYTLPYTFYSIPNYATTFTPAYQVNKVYIAIERNDAVQPVTPGFDLDFKVVAIDGPQ